MPESEQPPVNPLVSRANPEPKTNQWPDVEQPGPDAVDEARTEHETGRPTVAPDD